MASLILRDKHVGRDVKFPWPVAEGPSPQIDPMVKETGAGRCVLWTNCLADDALVLALTYPGGARFARISPETNWALEERKEGATPPEIAAEMDEVWRDTLALFAARTKELRESGLIGAGLQGEEGR